MKRDLFASLSTIDAVVTRVGLRHAPRQFMNVLTAWRNGAAWISQKGAFGWMTSESHRAS